MRTADEFKRVCALLAAQGTVVKARDTTPSRAAPTTTISGQPEAFRAALAWVRRNYPQHACYWDRVKLVTPAAIPRDLSTDDATRNRLQGFFDSREPDTINVVVRDGKQADAYVATLIHETVHARAHQLHTSRDYAHYRGFEIVAGIEGSSAAHEFRMDRLYDERLRRERTS